MAYFPMFVDITDKKCLVIGGGKVALRKVQVLLDFDAKVVVIAREISAEIRALEGKLSLYERKFEEADLDLAFMVVVATGDESLNERISILCKDRRIPVNVVDDKERCSFIFSSYIREGNLVGAFSSGGSSPVLAKYLKNKAAEFLTPGLGKLNDFMGKLRLEVMENVPTEKGRKLVYERLLEMYLKEEQIPGREDVETIIRKTNSRQ